MSADIVVAPLASPPGAALRSGRAELDRWLSQSAWSATRARSARVYTAHRGDQLVGYFALAAGSVELAAAGRRLAAGMPRHPIPVVLLARLAVAEDAAGGGVGRELVRRAGLVTLEVAERIAVRALVVDALDPQAARFYERVGFTPNGRDPRRLEMLVKDLAALSRPEP